MCADVVVERPGVLGQDHRAALVRMLRAMFPHEGFPDGPYERTIEALLADAAASPRLAGLLYQGAADLDRLGGRPFAELDGAGALALLRGIEDTPFLAAVKAKGITTFYNDQEVWERLGYEGPSFDKGGYVGRGFDDLDWLPDPPL